jgi:hypothetical protein
MPDRGWLQIASRVAHMDRHEFLDRTRQELFKRTDSFLARFGFDFSQVMVPRGGTAQKTFRGASPKAARFFFAPESVEPILNLLRQRLPQQVDQIVRQAEKICRHQFDLLGYEDLDYGDPIEWNLDRVHGKQAPKKAFHRIRYLDFREVGDGKITWELNRHQHLVTLAKAYRLTEDRRYADEIFQQWRHWHAENPYAVGINWASSLEVAFRSLSWIWMYQLLLGTPALPQEFRNDWLRAQALNGRYIERYLSTYFSPNTHLLGEAVALLFLGTMCPEISRAEQWKSRGWEIVLREAGRQVLPDGFHFERSSYYHVYAIDFFLHATVLASLNGLAIPDEFSKTLEKMLDALLVLGRAGAPPRLGDDDGGRLFDSRRNRSEHLLDPFTTGAVLFHRGDFKAGAGELREEMIWLLGEKGVAEWDRLPIQPASTASASLPSAGLYILAAQTPTSQCPTSECPLSQLVITAGPQGELTSGHGHADALSICLQSQGHALLIDPGTFEYVGNGAERNLFRATAMHNTLIVDGLSQSEIAGPFGWKRLAQTRVEQWIAGKTFNLFVGSHNGYGRLASPVLHRRWVVSLYSGVFLVRDLALGKDQHRLDIAWHLGPDMRLRNERLFEVQGTSCGLAVLAPDRHGWSEQVRHEVWSPAYGKRDPAIVLNFGTVTDLAAEFVTLLIPLEQANEIPGTFSQIDVAPPMPVKAYFYRTSLEECFFFFAETGRRWSQGRVSSDADFVCWQKKRGGEDELLIFCNGSYVEIDGRRVVGCKRVISHCEMRNRPSGPEIRPSEPDALF